MIPSPLVMDTRWTSWARDLGACPFVEHIPVVEPPDSIWEFPEHRRTHELWTYEETTNCYVIPADANWYSWRRVRRRGPLVKHMPILPFPAPFLLRAETGIPPPSPSRYR